MSQTTTLVFLIRNKQICLATKKRGFGEGYYNGYGGKQDPGETIAQTAVRELHEESGITITEKDLVPKAVGYFTFSDKPEWNVYCHIYFVTNFVDEPVETEEMKPEWFPVDAIPYDRMWPGDVCWLSQLFLQDELLEFDLGMTSNHELEHYGSIDTSK